MDWPLSALANKQRLSYITRQEAHSLWICVIPYRDANGGKHRKRKLFPDLIHGSRYSSLARAQQWRDEQLTLPEVRAFIEARHRRSLYSDVTENAPFGLVGIQPMIQGPDAYVRVMGKKGQERRVSMLRHGVWGAYEQAVKLRCEWLDCPPPDRDNLKIRFNRWFLAHKALLAGHGLFE